MSPRALRRGKDFALFFAIDAYAEWDKLRNPAAEVKKLAGELEANYGFEARVYENKSRSEILNILGEYRRRAYDDDAQLLVFFSGHGYYDGQCIGYVVPREGKRDDAEGASYISYPDLQSRVASIPCRHILLCVDACYAGTADLAANCPELFKGPVAPGRPNPPSAADAFIRETLREQSRAYYAAAGNTPTRDRSEFAAQFLEALQKDYDHLGLLTLSKLRDRLKYAQPRPWFGEFAGNRDADAFVFVRQAAKTPTPSADRDGDGVPNTADRCPDQYGPAANSGCPDTGANPTAADADGDGVPNDRDACPEAYGTARANGCPDADDDAVPDLSDRCPYLAGEPRWEGCPDTDSDGVPDHLDQCPTQKGLAADKGCPPPDRDSDGVPDRADRCPDRAGKQNLQGCPDADGDGIPDVDDKCPTEKGVPALDGCPEKAADRFTDPLVGVMIKVRGGTFQMGSNDGGFDEKPVHAVTLGDYYLGETEITQTQWRAVMGSDPPELHHKGCDQCPVEGVNWDDVQQFLQKLNSENSGKYRLPTEAEWEYAARGGSLSKGYTYAGSNTVGEVAWYRENTSGTKTKPVKGKKANELGFYDMSGNVEEWCSDLYDYYASGSQSNPKGPDSPGLFRVVRGSSLTGYAEHPRVAARGYCGPLCRGYGLGFRLAASPQ